MSTSDMGQYVASLPGKATDMDIENSASPSTDATMTHDDSTQMDTTPVPPSGSSLAIAASIGSGGDKSTLPTEIRVDKSPLQTQDNFIAVPMSPKRATAMEDNEAAKVSAPLSPKTSASSPKKNPASSPKKTPKLI